MALMWTGDLESVQWISARRNLEWLPKPRDWSPTLEEARKRLERQRRRLPAGCIVSLKKIDNCAPELVQAVSSGWAFVAKVGARYELFYVSLREGNIISTEWMWVQA